MKLTLYCLIHCIYNIYLINAFVPKQVDIGLDNSAEYTILACCDASDQIIGIKMSEIRRF